MVLHLVLQTMDDKAVVANCKECLLRLMEKNVTEKVIVGAATDYNVV